MERTFTSISLTAILVAGCGKSGADVADDNKTNDKQAAKTDDHSGWWCAEHGVPEKECSVCSSTAAEKFKKAGDWCKEHKRAESQCFKCDPSRAQKYVKLYKAKFGKEPPKPEE
ncbi:MAG: RND transporter [Planctomycetaceae bacterium]